MRVNALLQPPVEEEREGGRSTFAAFEGPLRVTPAGTRLFSWSSYAHPRLLSLSLSHSLFLVIARDAAN